MPYTAGLLGSVPSLTSDTGELIPIQGAPPSLIQPPPGCKFAARCPAGRPGMPHLPEPPLLATDDADHRSACHRWEAVAATPDVTMLFQDAFKEGETVPVGSLDGHSEVDDSGWAPKADGGA